MSANFHSIQPNRRTLAIFGCHKIGEPSPGGWETWYLIPGEVFGSQLNFLKTNSWQVVDVATFIAGLETPDRLPPRAALLTFDDGYRSILDCATTSLRELSCPAVVFVPTDFIGGRNKFDATTNQPEEEICGWDELWELDRLGISIESHGVSHRPFSKLDATAQERELRQSKVLLEDGLGKPVDVFAYPYGDCGLDPESGRNLLQRCGYRAACLYGGGPTRFPIPDPYRLTRLAMGAETDLHLELGSG